MSDWYKQDASAVCRIFNTDSLQGLAESEALLRFNQYGPNTLVEQAVRTPWQIFLNQFSSTVVIVLLVSTVISALLGDIKNAATIGVIVVLNALLGFIQERRAEEALAALKKLAVPRVKVRRENRLQEMSADLIVPGDIVSLETGNAIPADGHVIQSVNLKTRESALTGESLAVEKSDPSLGKNDRPLAERSNMMFSGTLVVSGRGTMVVTETGMKTELGRIAALMESVKQEATPLQKRLDELGGRLAMVALAIVAVIFVLGLERGEELKLLFMTAVSIAVAAVPEGLPAIITINLAMGAQRLLKKHALIRRLPAVETLGSVTAICTDKTGTLTQNKMEVKVLVPLDPQALNLLLVAGALCNDAIMETDLSGDPTETALLAIADRHGINKAQIERSCPRVFEMAFDSTRKRMSTVHGVTGSDLERILGPLQPGMKLGTEVLFAKGSVDSLLSVSNQAYFDGTPQPMNESIRARIDAAQRDLASRGMRVMGMAYRSLGGHPDLKSSMESDLVFVGLVGLQDPLRPEVNAAVRDCLAAGIRPIMITGDHPLTALSIAKELNFVQADVMTGLELEALTPAQLEERMDDVSVYARVTPEHKLNIVQALQNRGNVVAMTGDGVNDAPALKKADIGVAMGISGTDVAKEAADMILLDDNFATIVSAVKDGRMIYDNIRKFLQYLLTGNMGEIWLMLLAPLIGMPLPLLPVQILWMNLITDGIPALALGIDPADKNIMSRPPVPMGQSLFAQGLGVRVAWQGLMMGLIVLCTGAWYWHHGDPRWQTMTFTTLIFMHVVMALAFRSERQSFFQLPLGSNKPLLGAVTLSIALQLAGDPGRGRTGFRGRVRPLHDGDYFGKASLEPAQIQIIFTPRLRSFRDMNNKLTEKK